MKDNNTGKNSDFYALGKKMFDRLNPPGTPAFKPYFPKREWVGLTDVELEFWTRELGQGELGRGVLRAVADHLREKNHD